MSLSLSVFDTRQLTEEILGRSYLMPTEIEVYVRNLIRIAAEQQKQIADLQHQIDVLQ